MVLDVALIEAVAEDEACPAVAVTWAAADTAAGDPVAGTVVVVVADMVVIAVAIVGDHRLVRFMGRLVLCATRNGLVMGTAADAVVVAVAAAADVAIRVSFTFNSFTRPLQKTTWGILSLSQTRSFLQYRDSKMEHIV